MSIYTMESVRRRALYKLGEREFHANSATEDPVTLLYPEVLLEANRAGHWSWAKTRVLLQPGQVQDGMVPYTLPDDFLRLISVKSGSDHTLMRDSWELRGRTIYVHEHVNHGPLTVRYTRNIQAASEDLPDEPAFIEYLVTLLAARVAPAIIGQAGIQLEGGLMQQAQQQFMTALTQDKQQDSSNDQDPTRDLMTANILQMATSRR